MTYDVQLDEARPRPLAVVRRRAPAQDLSTVVPQACGEVWEALRALKTERPGRHVAVYLDGEINLEVGVEVAESFVGDGHVIRSATPAGLVATAAHIGPYHGLHGAHRAIREWCKSHGHGIDGPNWEIYGHWTDDLSKLRTDVFYLLKPATRRA